MPDVYRYGQHKPEACEITSLDATKRKPDYNLLEQLWKFPIDASILVEVNPDMIPMIPTYTTFDVISNSGGREKKLSIWDSLSNFSLSNKTNTIAVFRTNKFRLKFPTIFIINREEFYMGERAVVNLKMAEGIHASKSLPVLKNTPKYFIAQIFGKLTSIFRIPSTFISELIPPLPKGIWTLTKLTLMFTKIKELPTNVSDSENGIMIKQAIQRKACDHRAIKSLEEMDFIEVRYSCKY